MKLVLTLEERVTLQPMLLIKALQVTRRIKDLESDAEAIDPDELEDLQHDLEQIKSMLNKFDKPECDRCNDTGQIYIPVDMDGEPRTYKCNCK